MKKIKVRSDKDAAVCDLISEIPFWIRREADLPFPVLQNLAQLWLFVFPRQDWKKMRQVLLLVTIWIIITDRFFESRKISKSQLRIFCQNIDCFLKNEKENSNNQKISNKSMDFSERLLKNICQMLSEQKVDQRFWAEWKWAVKNFLTGMANERNFSFVHPPSLRQYLKNGRQSIGSSAVLYAVALLIFRARWLKPKEFAIIKKIIKDSSLVLRLINDLGSHERERAHKTLNSLVVLMKQGETLESAQEKIFSLIERNIAIFKQRKKSAPLKCRPFFTALSRLLRFTSNLYETKDYHGEAPRP